MKISLGLCLLAALLVSVSGATHSTCAAIPSAQTHMRAGFASALPHPILHLCFSRNAMIIEIGYRPAATRTAPAPEAATLRLKLTQAGRIDLLLHSPDFKLALPRRSA
jgi:hypothetical protein